LICEIPFNVIVAFMKILPSQILLALIVVLLDTDPGLGIGSPLVAVGVRDVQDTSAGDGGRSSELQVSDFKD
jgi:hypothetical protein